MSTLFDFISIATGLVFIFWLLSIITSYIMELIANFFQVRATNLANAVHLMLSPSDDNLNGKQDKKADWVDTKSPEIWDKKAATATGGQYHDFVSAKIDENPVKAFYSHPFVSTTAKPNRMPSYITPKTFSKTVLDLFSKSGRPADQSLTAEDYLSSIKEGVNRVKDEALKATIIPLIEDAERMEQDAPKRLALLEHNLEAWFISTMDRCAGWYKRWTTLVTIIIGILIAVALNADTIGITQALWRDSVLRQSVATAAANSYTTNLSTNQQTPPDQALTKFTSLTIPLGWSGNLEPETPAAFPDPRDIPTNLQDILSKLVGLILTGMAISLGSSIWFDALQKLINLRGSGNRPDTPQPQTQTQTQTQTPRS